MGLRQASSFVNQPVLLCVLSSFFLVPDGSAQDTERFEYDALGRLSKAENLSTGKQVEYGYDAAGNRTQVIANGGATTEFGIDDISVTEGGMATFTVTRTGATSQSHAVSYGTSNNTATAGNDFASSSGTLTFSAGVVTRTVSVSTSDDSTYEGGESFHVNLSNPTNGASISDSQGDGVIDDNDAAPAFSIADVTTSEGGNLLFTVTKSGSTSQSHDVGYATADGSADGSDYTGAMGTLSFAPGQASLTVSLLTLEDAICEADETLYVNLSSPTGGATIADAQAIGTINNDDAGPSFSINNASRVESQGPLVLTVTKNGTTPISHSVSYATAPGSASTADYVSVSGTLTFASGQTSRTISVPLYDDILQEGTESFYVNLSSPTNSATISDGQGIGTLFDNDAGCEMACN